jgi:hypothetical protein
LFASALRLSAFSGSLAGSLRPFFLTLQGIGLQLVDVLLLVICDPLEKFANGHLFDFANVDKVRVLVASHRSSRIHGLKG